MDMVEALLKFVVENVGGFTLLFTAIAASIYTTKEFFTKQQVKSEYLRSFEQTVSQLSSPNTETQLSAAILLRRFLNLKLKWLFFHKKYLFDETINVISSLLRNLPTGVYQKTLGDGLAYVEGDGLSNKDLQNANLQNVYLGSKNHAIKCYQTDFYMADLSYALVENIDGNSIIFYNSILMSTNIKNCNFTNGNFVGADLTNVYFKNVILENANFKDAINIPIEIQQKLVGNIYVDRTPITTNRKELNKIIFFSMPGVMTKEEEFITKAYKEILEKRGYDIIYYGKNDYPRYGQFSKIRRSIESSSGLIAFGFKQINIIRGVYRPNTDDEKVFNNRWFSTPWNDIEVGMAIMKGIPILLVHDKDIKVGVFDSILSEYSLERITSDCDLRKIGKNPVLNAWIKKVQIS